ncbi:hypothetical protein lerEdw1_001513, partial [Lerista edwardsae]
GVGENLQVSYQWEFERFRYDLFQLQATDSPDFTPVKCSVFSESGDFLTCSSRDERPEDGARDNIPPGLMQVDDEKNSK